MLWAPWFCDSTFYDVMHHRSFRRDVEKREHHDFLRLLFEHIRSIERTDLLNDGSEFCSVHRSRESVIEKWYTSELEFSVVEKGEETHEF